MPGLSLAYGSPAIAEGSEKRFESSGVLTSLETPPVTSERGLVSGGTQSSQDQTKAHGQVKHHTRFPPHAPVWAGLGCGFLDPSAPPMPSTLNLATL